MTIVSCLALATILGCSSTLNLSAANTPEVARRYSAKKEVIVWYKGRRYPIREAQAPKLRVTAWRGHCGVAPNTPCNGKPPPLPMPEALEAPLGEVRVHDDTLYFPQKTPVRAEHLTEAALVLDGEPPGHLPKGSNRGDRPAADSHHFLGVQVGGISFLEPVYRLRPFGPLYLEVGAMALVVGPAVGGVWGTAGLLVDVPVARPVSVLAGAGVGAGGGLVGENETGAGTAGIVYSYARLGLGLHVGVDAADELGFEAALWNTRDVIYLVPGFFLMRAL